MNYLRDDGDGIAIDVAGSPTGSRQCAISIGVRGEGRDGTHDHSRN